MKTENETILEMQKMAGVENQNMGQSLQWIDASGSRYVRDLKVNLSNVLVSDHLSQKEAYLLALAIAHNNKNHILLTGFSQMAKQHGAHPQEIAEALACANLLASNNVFYRFRHFVNKESYNKMPGRIKMNIMMKPVLGKEFFELISLAVSAVNGCEMCVKAHEDSVIKLGASEQRIWDTIRLASVINSLDRII